MQTRQAQKTNLTGKLGFFAAASFCCFFGLLLLFFPNAALSGARSGLSLCADVVIPSLFPFLCLTSFVIKSGMADKFGRLFEGMMETVFRMPGCAAAALCLGIVGGYPAGAAAVAGLCKNGSLSQKDGDRLLCFCINSGPAFIIGAVGAGLLHSVAAGALLYAAHIAASLIIGLLSRFFAGPAAKTRNAARPRPLPFAQAFVGAISESASSMLYISAFVVLFAAVISLFTFTGILPAIASCLASFLPSPGGGSQFYTRLLVGVFEVSNGCAAAVSAKGMVGILLAAAALGWSGLSVQCQIMAAVAGTGLSTKYYVVTRFLHVALSLILAYLLFTVFPSALPVFGGGTAQLPLLAASHSAPASAALLLMVAMLLLAQLKV